MQERDARAGLVRRTDHLVEMQDITTNTLEILLPIIANLAGRIARLEEIVAYLVPDSEKKS